MTNDDIRIEFITKIERLGLAAGQLADMAQQIQMELQYLEVDVAHALHGGDDDK